MRSIRLNSVAIITLAFLIVNTTESKAQIEGWGDIDSLPKRSQFDLDIKHQDNDFLVSGIAESQHISDFTSNAMYGSENIKLVEKSRGKCLHRKLKAIDSFDVKGLLVKQTFSYCDSSIVKEIVKLYKYEYVDTFIKVAFYEKDEGDSSQLPIIHFYNNKSGYINKELSLIAKSNDSLYWRSTIYKYNEFNQITSVNNGIGEKSFLSYTYSADTVENDTVVISVFDSRVIISNYSTQSSPKLLYKYVYSLDYKLCYLCRYSGSSLILHYKNEVRNLDSQCEGGAQIQPSFSSKKRTKTKIKYY